MKTLKQILSVMLSLLIALASFGSISTVAFADYDDGMDCPICGKYRWDDWLACDDCGMCIDCADDYTCPYCGECTYCAGESCGGCGACPDCAEIICSDCGEACWQCSDETKFCYECGRCGECNGETACPGCNECCGECDTKLQCGDCLFCEDCGVMICTECGNKCFNCSEESEFCIACGRCGECNGETTCPGCHETCGECDAKQQCGDCLYCEDCGEMICTECGNKCFNCSDDSLFCLGCGRCGECNGETVCPGCCETCGECDAKLQCGDCLYCEDCGEMICTECGNKCFNCSDDSLFCSGCGRCGECNHGSVCPGCNETCCECEEKKQCGECFYCEDCVDYICEGCETSCTNCVDEAEFCSNCGSCPDCNGGTTCPSCSATCGECNNIMQCRECFTCDDCTHLCDECKDICYDCDEGWCYGCNTCSDCNGGTACPDCHDTCESCGSAAQCRECYTCENCVLLCSSCGEICMECAADGWCFGCDTCADCNGGTACPGCGESCLECENKTQCKTCYNCADCADVCVECGDVCAECADSFCDNCHTCGDCNGDTVCPGCGNTCLECGNIDQCRECHLCADCTDLCSNCGEICADCADGWCESCYTCGDCNGDTVCPSCGMTCESCRNIDQCPECHYCADCTDICIKCGNACRECDPGFNETFCLCSSCDVQDAYVNAVIVLINAIGTVEYTPACKERIDAATAAYNALDAGKQQNVTNVNTLRDAGRSYARMKAEDDKRKANLVISGIGSIGTVTYSAECRNKITLGMEMYASLTADQKALVTNYDVLLAAEEEYARLEDQAAVDNVTAVINALPEEIQLSDKESVEAARDAFDMLSDKQKELVAADVLAKLLNAEAVVSPAPLVNTSFVESNVVPAGSNVKVTGSAEGGRPEYTFEYFYRKSDAKVWNAAANGITPKLRTEGSYEIRVVVTDKNGSTAEKIIDISVGGNSDDPSEGSDPAFTLQPVGGDIPEGEDVLTVTWATNFTPVQLQLLHNGEFDVNYSDPTTTSDEFLECENMQLRAYYGEGENDYIDSDTFTVEPFGLVKLKASLENSEITFGSRADITASAKGGTAPYTYAFYYKRVGTSKWTVIGTEFGTASTASFKPGVNNVYYQIRVIAKDAEGNISQEKIMNLHVYETQELKNTSNLNSSVLSQNSRVWITAGAEGGDGNYTYEYYYKRATARLWTSFPEGLVNESDASVTLRALGDYEVKVIAKDDSGETAELIKTVTIVDGKSTAFVNNSYVNKLEAKPNTKIVLTGAAAGSEGYKYAFYYKRSTAGVWSRPGTEFGEGTSVSFTPRSEGTYLVKIDIMDKNGELVSKNYTVTVSNDAADAPVNTSTVSSTEITAGTRLTVNGAASGGAGGYTYTFEYRKTTANKWNAMSSTGNTASIKLNNAGIYDIRVTATDSAGAASERIISVVVR